MYSYIDMHCDTLLRSLKCSYESIYAGDGMLDINRMKQAGQMGQFFAIFFPPENEKELMTDKAGILLTDDAYFKEMRKNLLLAVETHQDDIAMAYSYIDIVKNEHNGKMSAILSVEDGRMVHGDMNRLAFLEEQGVRAITLTWNYENCFGYPNSFDEKIMDKGLKPFGKDAIIYMNEHGILVDVSHLSDQGFMDVAEISKKPFIASHSNCREISPHSRNLTDHMIRVLAEHGGVSGLNFAPDFLNRDINDKNSTIKMLAEHVLHFINVGGEDCVGLGTDFDGIEGNFEIGESTKMHLLFRQLKKKGITERQLDKFTKGNVLRVIKEVL